VDLGSECYVSAVEVFVHHGNRVGWIGGGGMDATGDISRSRGGGGGGAGPGAVQDGTESIVSLVDDDDDDTVLEGEVGNRSGTVTTRQLRSAMASRGYTTSGPAHSTSSRVSARGGRSRPPADEADAPRPVGGAAGRTDATSRRFTPLHVLLARQHRPFPAVVGQGTLAVSKGVAVASHVHTSGRRLLSWQPPPMCKARFVRVVLGRNEHLAVAQVRVLGTSSK